LGDGINKVNGGGFYTAIAAGRTILDGTSLVSGSLSVVHFIYSQQSTSTISSSDLLQIYGDSYFENF